MRVLVCGSRTFEDEGIIQRVLLGFNDAEQIRGQQLTIVHGAAKGADSIAQKVAFVSGGLIQHDPYPADWNEHGKAAGPIRNQQMLDEGKPDMVIAFVDKPLHESRGTCDMVTRAEDAGLPVYVVEKLQ